MSWLPRLRLDSYDRPGHRPVRRVLHASVQRDGIFRADPERDRRLAGQDRRGRLSRRPAADGREGQRRVGRNAVESELSLTVGDGMNAAPVASKGAVVAGDVRGRDRLSPRVDDLPSHLHAPAQPQRLQREFLDPIRQRLAIDAGRGAIVAARHADGIRPGHARREIGFVVTLGIAPRQGRFGVEHDGHPHASDRSAGGDLLDDTLDQRRRLEGHREFGRRAGLDLRATGWKVVARAGPSAGQPTWRASPRRSRGR